MNKKVLIIGPASSILVRQRVEMLAAADIVPFWYSQSRHSIESIPCYFRLTNRRLFSGIIEMFYVFLLLCFIRPRFIHVFYAKNRWLNLVLALHPRLTVSVMGSDISEKTVTSGSLNFKLVKLLLNRAKIITSKSHYMDDTLKRFSVSPHRIKRVTWGIDITKFNLNLNSDSLRQRLAISATCQVFFSLRACKPLYQHESVLQAFYSFAQNQPNSVLLISTMGAEGNYLNVLKELSYQLDISKRIIFLPEIDNELMPLYYNLADAVISIPKSDGMPQSLYESMACGCFHILGDLPQYREIVEEKKSGLYVDMKDDSSLSNAFLWVSTHKNMLEVQAPAIRQAILPYVDRSIQQGVIQNLYKLLMNDDRSSKV